MQRCFLPVDVHTSESVFCEKRTEKAIIMIFILVFHSIDWRVGLDMWALLRPVNISHTRASLLGGMRLEIWRVQSPILKKLHSSPEPPVSLSEACSAGAELPLLLSEHRHTVTEAPLDGTHSLI